MVSFRGNSGGVFGEQEYNRSNVDNFSLWIGFASDTSGGSAIAIRVHLAGLIVMETILDCDQIANAIVPSDAPMLACCT